MAFGAGHDASIRNTHSQKKSETYGVLRSDAAGFMAFEGGLDKRICIAWQSHTYSTEQLNNVF
jgi:hypothetical protein